MTHMLRLVYEINYDTEGLRSNMCKAIVPAFFVKLQFKIFSQKEN